MLTCTSKSESLFYVCIGMTIFLCPVLWCVKTSVNHLTADPFSSVAVAFVKEDAENTNSEQDGHVQTKHSVDVVYT